MKTGIVSGCFDWTTPAHIRLFELAREHCDVLHVLMGCDKTVEYWKGKGRPLIPYRDRRYQVMCCKFVNGLILKLEKHATANNQENLIVAVKPKIYVEGVDATDTFIGEYLERHNVERITVNTRLPHLQEYLDKYTQGYIDTEMEAAQDLQRIAGL